MAAEKRTALATCNGRHRGPASHRGRRPVSRPSPQRPAQEVRLFLSRYEMGLEFDVFQIRFRSISCTKQWIFPLLATFFFAI